MVVLSFIVIYFIKPPPDLNCEEDVIETQLEATQLQTPTKKDDHVMDKAEIELLRSSASSPSNNLTSIRMDIDSHSGRGPLDLSGRLASISRMGLDSPSEHNLLRRPESPSLPSGHLRNDSPRPPRAESPSLPSVGVSDSMGRICIRAESPSLPSGRFIQNDSPSHGHHRDGVHVSLTTFESPFNRRGIDSPGRLTNLEDSPFLIGDTEELNEE